MAATYFSAGSAVIATLLAATPLASAESFLVVDQHRCIETGRQATTAVTVPCAQPQAPTLAILDALFEAGHIVFDATSTVGLAERWHAGDGVHGFTDVLNMAREAGAEVLVLVFGSTSRSAQATTAPAAAGRDRATSAYQAHLTYVLLDAATGGTLGSGEVQRAESVGGSTADRREFERQTGAALAAAVLQAWGDTRARPGAGVLRRTRA